MSFFCYEGGNITARRNLLPPCVLHIDRSDAAKPQSCQASAPLIDQRRRQMTLTPQVCLLLGQATPSPPPVEPSSRSCQSLSSSFHSMDTSSCVCTEESCSPSPGETKHHKITTRSFAKLNSNFNFNYNLS